MKENHSIKFSVIACLVISIALSGCAYGRKKISNLRWLDTTEIEQDVETPPGTAENKGYLASGPTIRVKSEIAEFEGTIIEQFEKVSKELQENKERLKSVEKEIDNLKTSKKTLQTELKNNHEKLVIAQQILVENEMLNNDVKGLKLDLSAVLKQIKRLNENLLKTQISEVKIKQELVSARIMHLQELKTNAGGLLLAKPETIQQPAERQ